MDSSAVQGIACTRQIMGSLTGILVAAVPSKSFVLHFCSTVHSRLVDPSGVDPDSTLEIIPDRTPNQDLTS